MLKHMKKRLGNEQGLTLIELLAVIVILAIIAAIAIPAIGGIIENSKYKAAKADAINIINAGNLYFTDNPSETSVTVENLKAEGYLDSIGVFTTDTSSKVEKDANGNKITGTVTYTDGKTVEFEGVNVAKINDDKQRGSASGDKTISP